MSDLDRTKIVPSDLRDFAAVENDAQRRSVIVELGGPASQVTLSQPSSSFSPRGLARPEILEFGDDSGQAEAMDRLERELAELGLDRKLVRLESAGSFVVNVTSEQLRAISNLPLVGMIRPNREHRGPRRKVGG